MSASVGRELRIRVQAGETLGITVNNKMYVFSVEPRSPADGHIKVGDQVLTLNGTAVESPAQLDELLHFAPPFFKITICRDEARATQVLALIARVPLDRALNISERDGFSYQIVTMYWHAGGRKLGLGVKGHEGAVLVSMTSAGSCAADCLMVGDRIIDINGQPSNDKDAARRVLLEGVKDRGEVSLLIERAITDEAKLWSEMALRVEARSPPSVRMGNDVRDCAQKERTRIADKSTAKPMSILKTSVVRAPSRLAPVIIDHNQWAHAIDGDYEAANLRAVPSRSERELVDTPMPRSS